jgi:uncharacterized caspase-like protein
MSRSGFAIRLSAFIAVAVCLWQAPASAQVSPRIGETASAVRQINTGTPLRTASLENGASGQAAVLKERRLALVIGNSNYESVKALPNPANDAKAIAQLLNSAGFEVVMAFDLDRDSLRQVVSEFSARITESGPNSTSLVYYAGHGLQVDGENFLVPVDAKIENEADVAETSVRLADVMQALEAAPSRVRIVILDACRNNPFSALGEAGGKGLAIVDAPAGSIVAYATAPGTEAFDGAGQHSPYTAAFIKSVKQPGLPIEQLFKRVRVLVADATDAKQMPWESSSLTSDFVFFTTDPNANVAAAPVALPEKVAVAQLATRSVERAYEVVVAEDSVEYYEEFVRIYPSHPLCDRIRRLLSQRLQMIAWHKATKVNSPDGYKTFLSKYNNSDLAGNARKLIERPRLVTLPFTPKNDIKTGPVIGFPKNGPIKTGPVLGIPQNGNGQNGNNQGGIKTGPIVKPNGTIIPFPQNGQNGQNNQNGNIPGKVTTLPNPNGAGSRLPGNGQVVTLPKPGETGANKNTGVVGKLPEGKVTTLPAKTEGRVIRRDLQNGNTGVITPKIQKIQVQSKPGNSIQIRRDVGIQRQTSVRQSAGGSSSQFRR